MRERAQTYGSKRRRAGKRSGAKAWVIWLGLLAFVGIAGGIAGVPGTAGAAIASAASASAQAASASAVKHPPTVYLTFDDGPSNLTDQVLAILKKEKVLATFFVLGAEVKAHPDKLRAIAAAGHAIGNHTYDHVYKELYGSFHNFADQVVATEKIIADTAGVQTRLLRAPGGTYGNFDRLYFDSLQQAGYILFDWNVDSGDARRKNVPASEIVANVKGTKLKTEMIVLMHDGKGHDESVKALPAIIAFYKKQGYTFGKLSDAVTPTVFRLADQLKWSRKEPSLETAVAWLGGAGAAVPAAEAIAPPAAPEDEAASAAWLAEWNMLPSDLVYVKGAPYVSLRLWADRMEGTAEWDPVARQSTYAAQDRTLTLSLDSGTLVATNEAGEAHSWRVPVVEKSGGAMIPLDALRTALLKAPADDPVALTLSEGQSYNDNN
ncbi:polysaccharide deacetylase family protein [Cohnella sp. REN36]|uniref:polysaccharide deacetylase family protein n=1 Tax=Cohnella sp. REN36 TaxID=2887347 RepID=UPI001D13D75D|nr:polysaccharide deacetylase family protein [Cohnella sp. REN36]MCC3376427.1 polysaccharide deacetylase [Cohnella sp. REN36]